MIQSYEKQAEILYSEDAEKLRKRAMAAGKLIDNRLKLEYSVGGHTHCFFDVSNYMKYFSYDALGYKRCKILMDYEKKLKIN